MASRSFKVLLEFDPDEKVWVSYVPTLDNISTFAETKEEAIEMTRELVRGYLEAAEKEGLHLPVERPDVEVVDLEVALA